MQRIMFFVLFMHFIYAYIDISKFNEFFKDEQKVEINKRLVSYLDKPDSKYYGEENIKCINVYITNILHLTYISINNSSLLRIIADISTLKEQLNNEFIEIEHVCFVIEKLMDNHSLDSIGYILYDKCVRLKFIKIRRKYYSEKLEIKKLNESMLFLIPFTKPAFIKDDRTYQMDMSPYCYSSFLSASFNQKLSKNTKIETLSDEINLQVELESFINKKSRASGDEPTFLNKSKLFRNNDSDVLFFEEENTNHIQKLYVEEMDTDPSFIDFLSSQISSMDLLFFIVKILRVHSEMRMTGYKVTHMLMDDFGQKMHNFKIKICSIQEKDYYNPGKYRSVTEKVKKICILESIKECLYSMEYINNETLDILSIDNVEGVNIDSLDLQSIDSKIAGYQSIVEKRILGININYEIEDIFKNDTELYTEVLQVIKKNNKILEKYCNRDMHKNKSLVKKLLSNNQITFIGGKESVTILQLLHLTFETLHSEDKKFNKRRIIFGYNYFMNKNRQKLEETYNILFQNEEKEVGSTLSKDLDERINLLLIERDVDFYEMEKNLLEDIIKRLSLFVDKSYVYFYATLFALKSDNVCKSVDYNEQLTLSFLNSILIKAKIYFLINCFKQELFSASQNFISEH